MKAQRNEIKSEGPRVLPAENIATGPVTTCTGLFDQPRREIFVKRGLPVGRIRGESPASQARRADSQ